MSWREHAAGISGGVLGYISGNVPGAFYGYKLGRKLSQKSMPPVKRKWTVRISPKKRRKTSVSSGSSGEIRKFHRRGTRKIVNVIGYGYKGKVVRRSRVKRKKKVKVSRKLRDKIKKVVSGTKPKGLFQETAYDEMRLFATEDNKQMVNQISGFTGGAFDPLFSPARVMDAASVLWNEKDQLRTGKTIMDLENFDRNKFKVKVIKQSVTYTIKNNTQRVMTLKLIECEAKNNQILLDAQSLWNQEMGFEATLDGPNQSVATLTEMHVHPSILPQFSKMYKTNTSTFVLEPGQTIIHKVHGPSDTIYDYMKFWSASTYQPIMKGSKFVIAVYYVDMVTQTTTGLSPDTVQGRYMNINPTNDLKYAMLCESVHRFELEMPEQTGLIGPVAVAPDATPLDQRQFSYAFKTYPSDIQSGTPGVVSIQTVLPTEPGSFVNPFPGT